MKKGEKRYIVRKYINAKSAIEAIKRSKNREPDDVWIDDEWKKDSSSDLSAAIGFEHYDEED